MFNTQPGLKLQGLGERPAAAFVRGINVNRMHYVYALLGGSLVGVGGAAFSLLVKPGWARPYGIEGIGWIVLALVIFGGWRPLRAALGAYLFVHPAAPGQQLQSVMPERADPGLPDPAVPPDDPGAPAGDAGQCRVGEPGAQRLPENLRRFLVRTLKALQTSPPAALGTIFEKE